MPINNESLAGYVTLTGKPLNLADVDQIEATAPYQFGKKFDLATDYHTNPVLTIPLTTPDGSVLGVLQAINAKDETGNVVPFSGMDEITMMTFAGIASVALERAGMTRATLLRMIKMAELRDPRESGAHVNRVGSYAVELYEKWARQQSCPKKKFKKNRDILRMAAMLHDVGKVGISDTILKKPGKLDTQKYETMKEHVLLGARLFDNSRSDFDRAAADVNLNHHEKWDGSGYPGHVNAYTGQPLPVYAAADGHAPGKQGEEIPIFGRIVALADVFDALSSIRTYKPAWDEGRVLETLQKDAGSHFDPALIDIFFSSLDIMRSIQLRHKE